MTNTERAKLLRAIASGGYACELDHDGSVYRELLMWAAELDQQARR